jgi:hypothetical protein
VWVRAVVAKGQAQVLSRARRTCPPSWSAV